MPLPCIYRSLTTMGFCWRWVGVVGCGLVGNSGGVWSRGQCGLPGKGAAVRCDMTKHIHWGTDKVATRWDLGRGSTLLDQGTSTS